ncbi:MAG: hypothetical protein ACFB16_20620 [Phormidesmis sp.]
MLPFKRELLMAAYEETIKLYEEHAERSADFRQIYTQWKDFRTKVYSWNRTNELRFDRFAMQAAAT